jgi:hypothetical protein
MSPNAVEGGVAESQPMSTAVNRSPNAGGGAVSGSQPMITAVNRRQINFGDLTPYLTYGSHLNKPTYKYVVHLEVCLLAGGLIVELHEGVLQGVARLLVPYHLAVLHLSKSARTSTVRVFIV